MNNGINTRNESTLHRTLKTLYSLDDGCRCEVPLDGKVYDIVDSSGNITEIQTASVSSLRGKVQDALDRGRKIRIVHPIAIVKTIESYTIDGILARRKKSPLHKSVYDMWREITGLTSVLLCEGFSLEILEVEITEVRIIHDRPVQSANGRRHWRRTWNKTDKRLDKILCTYTFNTARDYTALLPHGLPDVFCVSDVASAIRLDKSLPKSAAEQAQLMLWVLSHSRMLEVADKKTGGRYKMYRRPQST